MNFLKDKGISFNQVLSYCFWACCCGGSLAGLICTYIFENASTIPSWFCLISSITLGLILIIIKKKYDVYPFYAMVTLGCVCFPILYINIGGVTSAFTYYLFAVPMGYGLTCNKKWHHALQVVNLFLLECLIARSCYLSDMTMYEESAANYMIVFAVCWTMFFSLTFLSSRASRFVEKTLTDLYEHDELTGLKNRYCVEKERKLGFPQVIAAFDIDHFKRINDAYLHSEGDKILVQFADILKDIECDEIKVYRVGGEEFLLLSRLDMYVTNSIIKEHIIDRVRNEMKDPGGNSVTVSCGICWEEKDNVDKWKLADSYLYMAKFGGRNKVIFNGVEIY